MSHRWNVTATLAVLYVIGAAADAFGQGTSAYAEAARSRRAEPLDGSVRSAAELLRPIGTSSVRPYRPSATDIRGSRVSWPEANDRAAVGYSGQTHQFQETSLQTPSPGDHRRSGTQTVVSESSRARGGDRSNGLIRTAGFASARQVPAVRQAMWMQSETGRPMAAPLPQQYTMPGDSGGSMATQVPPQTPPAASSSVAPGVALPPAATSTVPRSLPQQPSPDYDPLPQPEMADGTFATLDNCACVSAPSTYTAASGWGCGSPVAYAAPATFSPPPAEFAAPAVVPPTTMPAGPLAVAPATAAPARSLFTLGQELYPVQVGQGLWGQPVAYVPGQHVRNWLRYLSF